MIRDRNIDWARRRIFRGAQQFATLVTNATGPVSCDAGASTLVEIGTKGLGGLKCTATTDLVQDLFPIPWDYDTEQKSYWRVYWASDTTAVTKTFTPTMKYTILTDGTAIAAAATGFSSNPASDLSLGANTLAVTGWGYLNANLLTGGKTLNIGIQTKGTCATKDVWIIGYEVEYTPHTSRVDVGRMGREPERTLDY